MGGLNVKNTIVERVLEKLAPHPCSGCTKIGTILCTDCKYDIIFESFDGCFLCERPTSRGICERHQSYLEYVTIIGLRHGTLQKLIDSLKFHHAKAAALPLAELLHERLPPFPTDAILVPVPTAPPHIRERGYDQTLLIAKHLAELRNTSLSPILQRKRNTTQHTESREVRSVQAAKAFALRSGATVATDRTYILVDDIITTGSTLQACAELIHKAGGKVSAIGLAYQPLD